MKKLIAVAALLWASSVFGQETNFTFDGGQHMTSSTGCADVLTRDGTTYPVEYTALAAPFYYDVIVSGYTQNYSPTGYYVCFQENASNSVPGLSLYLSGITRESGAPLTYGDKQWLTRADGTVADGTQNGDSFTWVATSSFPDGSAASLILTYITEQTRVKHCRGGRGFTCWYTLDMVPYLQSGTGTYFQ